jgi:hypothetical protein
MKHNGILFQKGLVAWGEYNKTQVEYYDQFQLLVKFDPEKGSAERIINLEESSPFRSSGRSYEISEMYPCFTILDDKLLVIAGTDPHLNVYDIKSPTNSWIGNASIIPIIRWVKGKIEQRPTLNPLLMMNLPAALIP